MGETSFPPAVPRLGAELCLVWVDVGDDAAIPGDADQAALRDLVNDAAVTRAQTERACVVGNQLDPRAYRDPRLDSCRKKTCASGIHDGVIGSGRPELDRIVGGNDVSPTCPLPLRSSLKYRGWPPGGRSPPPARSARAMQQRAYRIRSFRVL